MSMHAPLPTLALVAVLALGSLPLTAATALLPAPGSPNPAIAPSSDDVGVTRGGDGITVGFTPSSDRYPGIRLTPAEPWDLSAAGGVTAHLTNTGATPLRVFLRVDNRAKAKDPWNCEGTTLAPGASGTLSVRFGRSWGKPGYALDPSKVSSILLYTDKPKATAELRLSALEAGGPTAAELDALRRPRDGALFGRAAPRIDAERVEATGASAGLIADGDAQRLRLRFAADGTVAVLAPAGRWDLRDHLRVRAVLRNLGATEARPRLQLRSKERALDWVEGPVIAPGTEGEVVSSWLTTDSWSAAVGAKPKHFLSDHLTRIALAAGDGAELELVALVADVPPEPQVPSWLGSRPPEDGEWTVTFEDGFDGDALDETRWSPKGRNFWDKRSHFTPEQVLVGDGVAKLRFEAKRGRHNGEPDGEETDYATGFLHSWERFAQRYGYFECRLKTPTAPGLWPAFWLMPDRGEAAGIWWKRRGTGSGGMEFDIFEHLTRYGPNRTNLAFHWDGYEKDHKSMGTDAVYYQPDAEGFVTAGLLWEPGRARYYLNGREVLSWASERVASVPMYIIITNVSGGWGGNSLTGEGLPDDLVIDYVRVWQRTDLAASE